jgi:hypothetical protein
MEMAKDLSSELGYTEKANAEYTIRQESRLVKLQFRKQKRKYKRKTYEYERVSLNFPAESTQTLQPLRDKQLNLSVTKKDEKYHVTLSDKERK